MGVQHGTPRDRAMYNAMDINRLLVYGGYSSDKLTDALMIAVRGLYDLANNNHAPLLVDMVVSDIQDILSE